MKKVFAAVLVLIALVVVTSSCSSSRKSGCPGNPQASYKFRG